MHVENGEEKGETASGGARTVGRGGGTGRRVNGDAREWRARAGPPEPVPAGGGRGDPDGRAARTTNGDESVRRPEVVCSDM